MAIDFFSYAEAVPTQKEFAICDDKNQKPVKMEHVGDSVHQVLVISNNRSDYSFIAVDHNITLKREDGSDDRICDAMLVTDKSVCFIEIKCWIKGSWILNALEQIKTTIVHFDKNHPCDTHKYRDAYICNWKKRNTLLNESRMELKNDLFKNYRAHLYIANTIKELV